MQRRAFLQLLNGGVGAALLARPLALAAARDSALYQRLSPHEALTLEAICAHILPPVNGVSTQEAGCVNFIDKALLHEDHGLLVPYRSGIAALDRCARMLGKRDFAGLGALNQRRLLEQLEDGTLDDWNAEADQSTLFASLHLHTLLGFLAAPAYGGNRGQRGWQAIGFGGDGHRHGAVSDAQVAGEQPVAPSGIRLQEL